MLEEVLQNTSPINEIFSNVSLTWVGSPFLCYPSQFTSTNDQRKLFITNHKLKSTDKLLNGSLNTDISVSYSVDYQLLEVAKKRFPNMVYRHEIESLFKYIQSDVKPTGSYLVLDQNESHSLMLVKVGDEYKLINQYDSKELADVFYFTMLAIEQLDLNIETLQLLWMNPGQPEIFDGVKSMFSNYIQHIISVDIPANSSTALTTSIACG